jgi:hypothetical protein
MRMREAGGDQPSCNGGRRLMKTLSVIMPWPLLIMHYGKDVENRTWATNYRGKILIHASKKAEGAFDTLHVIKEKGLIDFNGMSWLFSRYPSRLGCIIGSVELVDCVQNSKSRWAEPGMWHWVLRDPIPLENPIPVRGSLGLWEYKGPIKWMR